jgi:hypothetical protein
MRAREPGSGVSVVNRVKLLGSSARAQLPVKTKNTFLAIVLLDPESIEFKSVISRTSLETVNEYNIIKYVKYKYIIS